MKHILSILIAVILIAVVYFFQFGMPSFIGDLLGPGEQQAAGNRAAGGSSGANGGQRAGRRSSGATYVTLADVVFKPYQDSYTAIGTGDAENSVSLVSEVSGQVRDVLFEGTPLVAKGDLLIQLVDESERINVEIAEANLSKAEDSLERYQTLFERNSGAVTAVTMKEAEAAVAVAKGNLALAEVSLEQRAIRSPIAGRLGLSEIQVGDFLSNGTKIVDINNTETIFVTFELPERAIDILALGKEVRATTPSKHGKVYVGKIVAFDSQIDETTRTVTVKAAIANKDGELWPGMTFIVGLVETSDALASVPSMALTWSREGTQVWVAEEGKVRSVSVVFLKRQDDTIWVEGDLKDGSKVVVDGVHKLRPGARIAVAGGDGASSKQAGASDAAPSGKEKAR